MSNRADLMWSAKLVEEQGFAPLAVRLREIAAKIEEREALEDELFSMRRWACDASLALGERRAATNIGRARTNVERIYKRLLKLTDERPRPAVSVPGLVDAAPRPTSTGDDSK